MPKPGYSDAENKEIRRGFAAGLDDLAIGRSIGRTESAICTQRKKLGLIRTERRRADKVVDKPEIRAAIEADFNANISPDVTARRLEISRHTVYRIRDELGLKVVAQSVHIAAINRFWAARGETRPVMKNARGLRSRLVNGVPGDRFYPVME